MSRGKGPSGVEYSQKEGPGCEVRTEPRFQNIALIPYLV
jgi:hypothetical protein